MGGYQDCDKLQIVEFDHISFKNVHLNWVGHIPQEAEIELGMEWQKEKFTEQ